jgi:hypothetical protein
MKFSEATFENLPFEEQPFLPLPVISIKFIRDLLRKRFQFHNIALVNEGYGT